MTDEQKRAVLERYRVYKERVLTPGILSVEELARRREMLVEAVKKWRVENERR